jgi:oligoribonuclease
MTIEETMGEPATAISIPATNLIWIDLEMTGLDTSTDRIIEIATIVTDEHLNEVAVGPVLAIHQPESVLEAMDAWNTKQHRESGLVARVQASGISIGQAEEQTLAFLRKHVDERASPMCGNSICQDRRFLARLMPTLESHFHYRNLDVSTLKLLAQRWAPAVAAGFTKVSAHLALADIRDSIAELAWYRGALLNQDVLRKDL